jgi:hypothetical protein
MSCRYCIDGLVVTIVGPEPYGEAFGPCPKCEAGHLLEFPAPDEKGKTKPGTWGKDGFWRGRDHSWLEPLPDPSPLPRDENRRRMKELLGSLSGAAKEMPK